jgi:hypothetical protein
LITVESIFGGGANEPAPTFATVVMSARWSDDPIGHLLLDHHDRVGDRFARVDDLEQERRSDVIRQVAADGDPFAAPLRGHLEIVAKRIDLLDLDVIHAGELGAQHLDHVGIELECDDLPRGDSLGDPRGQRAEPGADLDDPILVGADGRIDDRAECLLGDEEVLAKRLLRVEPVPREDHACIGERFHRAHRIARRLDLAHAGNLGSARFGTASRSRPARSPRSSRW